MAEVTERDRQAARAWLGTADPIALDALARRLAAHVAEERAGREKAEQELNQIGKMARVYGWKPEVDGERPLIEWLSVVIETESTDRAFAEMKRREVEARLRDLVEAADWMCSCIENGEDASGAPAAAAYRKVRDASPEPVNPCSTSTCGNVACAKELRHVFHNRLDEQQRKEGEQEPCALCGRMLDDALHARPEPPATSERKFAWFRGEVDHELLQKLVEQGVLEPAAPPALHNDPASPEPPRASMYDYEGASDALANAIQAASPEPPRTETVAAGKAYQRLITAVNKAVGQLADDVARDLDHDNRAHPKWWKAVQEERAALLALDASPGPEASKRHAFEFVASWLLTRPHDFSPSIAMPGCYVCGCTRDAHLCTVCGLPWSQHGGRDGE